ncbi:MAG: hypothetical protein AABW91_02275 [Nanoarchaeota archaeon]
METSNILDANCTNCEYVKYEHTDGIRLENAVFFIEKENLIHFQ